MFQPGCFCRPLCVLCTAGAEGDGDVVEDFEGDSADEFDSKGMNLGDGVDVGRLDVVPTKDHHGHEYFAILAPQVGCATVGLGWG